MAVAAMMASLAAPPAHAAPRKAPDHHARPHHAVRHVAAAARAAAKPPTPDESRVPLPNLPPSGAPAGVTDPAVVALFDSNIPTVWRQTGVASWYGGLRWQGHRTASGERYDQNKLTAAHATLPIGTRVRVTLEGTGRSVVVVINDRPGTRKRVIDLSRKAAAELGILQRGIAVVTLSQL